MPKPLIPSRLPGRMKGNNRIEEERGWEEVSWDGVLMRNKEEPQRKARLY